MQQVKSKLLLLIVFCIAESYISIGQSCENIFQEIDTFCTGTSYFFGDTIIMDEGFYVQTFKDIDDCDSIVNLDLRETPNATFLIDIDTLAPSCIGDSLGGFMVNVENAVEPIQYAILDGFFSFNQVSLPLENPQSSNIFEDLRFGRYTLVIIDRFGCGGLANINLSLQAIQGAMTIDTLCAGSSIQIGNQLITEAGIYIDTLTSSKGCDSIVTIDLRVEEFDDAIDFDLLSVAIGCRPNELGSIEVANISGGTGPFNQFINGEPFSTIATDLEVGTYEILVEDRFRCNSSQVTELIATDDVFELSVATTEPVNLGESLDVSITATTEIETINWNSIPNNSCPDCLEFSFRPLETFDFILTAVNPDGCRDMDTLSVVVLEGQPLFIPDIIRPNSTIEGNQIFSIFANPLAVRMINDLAIFDRYGNQVFSNQQLRLNDISSGWNGKFNGDYVEQGVYSYRAEVQFVGGDEEVIFGTFLVVF